MSYLTSFPPCAKAAKMADNTCRGEHILATTGESIGSSGSLSSSIDMALRGELELVSLLKENLSLFLLNHLLTPPLGDGVSPPVDV